MKKSSLWLITALMTLALLGVFVMQLYYLRESYKLNSKLFEENVSQALNAVVNTIQKRNAAIHINKKDDEIKFQKENAFKSQTDTIVAYKVRYKENQNLRKLKQQQQIFDYIYTQDSAMKREYIRPEIISEETFKIYSNPHANAGDIKNLNVDVEDIKDKSSGNLIGRRITPRLPKTPVQMRLLPDTIRYVALSPEDMLPRLISLPTMDPDLVSKFKIEDAKAEKKYQMELNRLYTDTPTLYSDGSLKLVQDVAAEIQNKNIPLFKRIPTQESLDTLIKRELLSKNITLDYNFWITPATNNHQILYQKAVHTKKELVEANTYSRVLFGNDVATKDPGMLFVSFPSKNSLIYSNMFVSMTSSIGLLLVLIFIFAYTIYAIIRQKKLSEMKTDFINNMTHEFKTPVATIMIASESLKDPEVTEDKNRINRLASIIYDENVRLGNHIERVLSVARLEKKEITLDVNPVKINELVTAVVDSMDLQLKKKNATVILNLNASTDLILGDELHLSNVIYNLIDNANKYSMNDPKIEITTKSNAKYLLIEISDEGIGMTKEQSKRIFDQFYRVPTGNLHDVKGFGLGLNYVQDIVTQMGGTIKVHSEKDKGTTFEVCLPFKKSNN